MPLRHTHCWMPDTKVGDGLTLPLEVAINLYPVITGNQATTLLLKASIYFCSRLAMTSKAILVTPVRLALVLSTGRLSKKTLSVDSNAINEAILLRQGGFNCPYQLFNPILKFDSHSLLSILAAKIFQPTAENSPHCIRYSGLAIGNLPNFDQFW